MGAVLELHDPRLSPDVESTLTGVFRFAFGLFLLRLRWCGGFPVDLETSCFQFLPCFLEESAVNDVVIHLIAVRRSTWCASLGSAQTDPEHFARPYAIMVARCRRLVLLVSPLVRQF